VGAALPGEVAPLGAPGVGAGSIAPALNGSAIAALMAAAATNLLFMAVFLSRVYVKLPVTFGRQLTSGKLRARAA
jgi:hypothetical protein